MMLCPKCDSNTSVIDSRVTMASVRRRRCCKMCRYRFTTYEYGPGEWDKLPLPAIVTKIKTLCEDAKQIQIELLAQQIRYEGRKAVEAANEAKLTR